jgi:2-phospho-L-lactate/phosphoenolpyruvate guanylyltransferase
MTCWALVPVKRRAACKQRLAGQLSPEQRLQLVRQMLAGVVDAVRQSKCVDALAFVSEERDTIPAGIRLLPDAGAGLNSALAAARQALIGRGAEELVVLPADLPFVTGPDIDVLVEAGRGAGCALATDRAGLGTNALWLPAHAPIRFQFGPGSRLRHVEEAERLGLAPALVSLPGLAFDVDGPDDLDELLERGDPRYLFMGSSSGGNRWPVRRQKRFG